MTFLHMLREWWRMRFVRIRVTEEYRQGTADPRMPETWDEGSVWIDTEARDE